MKFECLLKQFCNVTESARLVLVTECSGPQSVNIAESHPPPTAHPAHLVSLWLSQP